MKSGYFYEWASTQEAASLRKAEGLHGSGSVTSPWFNELREDVRQRGSLFAAMPVWIIERVADDWIAQAST